MERPLLTVELRFEHDVVSIRQRARQIALALGFDLQDQTRVATAVSEIARNAFQYGGGGLAEFAVDDDPPATLVVRLRDRGPGIRDLQRILDGEYRSTTGMGVGIVGARRLMDRFAIESAPGRGTVVTLGKTLAHRKGAPRPEELGRVAQELASRVPETPLQELQAQNRELLRTLEDLRLKREELVRVNRELEDTNRGVVALYSELDEKADFLRRAYEVKSRFLSNMSHEFRTPLNSILSLARLLIDGVDGTLNPEQSTQVNMIRRSAETLAELVNDLLDLAKVEAGKLTVRPSEFEVGALFGALRGMLRPLLASNRAVELVFEEPEPIRLLTDESKVSQILRNFISNAIKFTPKGEVRISARATGDGRVTFTVADQGVGIAPEDLDRIFEEFVTIDSASETSFKGTGLGLPLSKRLAELLGGSVAVASRPGEGSVFTATVPTPYMGPREVSFVGEARREVDATRLPLLAVEDNRETLFLYEKYLKGSGFQLVGARSIRQAREVLASVRPAAILLDILLEGENAWSFLSELKSAEATRTIPVFVATLVENEGRARALGADDFAPKPLDREWLLERLRAVRASTGLEKALVIDDDETSRYLLRGLLGDTRFEVLEASGGQDGLRQARAVRPSVIFLDLAMPDLSGTEVLDRLKSDPDTRGIPVIVNTSKALSQEEKAVLLKGAVAVLSKESVPREQGLQAIRTALRAARGNGHAAS